MKVSLSDFKTKFYKLTNTFNFQFLKFMNHKKSRLTDLFRKMDKNNDGLIPRDDFIDGIMRTSKNLSIGDVRIILSSYQLIFFFLFFLKNLTHRNSKWTKWPIFLTTTTVLSIGKNSLLLLDRTGKSVNRKRKLKKFTTKSKDWSCFARADKNSEFSKLEKESTE